MMAKLLAAAAILAIAAASQPNSTSSLRGSSSAPAVPATRWPLFIWYKQGHGSTRFASRFGDVPKKQVVAEKLVLATVEGGAGEGRTDKEGMLNTFGAEGATFDVYVRPDYAKLASYLTSKNACTGDSCDTSTIISYLTDMLANFESSSHIKASGIACQQEEGFNPDNTDFKCKELMVAIDGKYPFLQIEGGYGCYKVQSGLRVNIAESCQSASASCLCPTYHLEEKTYEPYAIGGFKPAPYGHACKSNEGNYCCTFDDSVDGAKCPDWDINNQCFMTGDAAASSYGKLIGLWWKSDATFESHLDGHVSCIGIGSPDTGGNANCAIDPASAPNAAFALEKELGADAKALCFY